MGSSLSLPLDGVSRGGHYPRDSPCTCFTRHPETGNLRGARLCPLLSLSLHLRIPQGVFVFSPPGSKRTRMRGPRSIIPALLAVCWLAPLRAEAQSGTIRGHVNDAAGKGLSGAIVSYSSRTVQTRADGSYSLIGISAGTDTLRAKMIGYGSTARAVTVRSGQTLDADLVLTAQAVSLAEIVVTGYGEQRAGDITGAVTSVSDSQFNTGRIVSPQMLIQSKVAGVQVVDNNDPGGGLSL